ncbi:SPASM domain-containing protein [candidate division KSB1 bacterium]|nr:SPASM domain-containing protein [candidate division KSB1 bacterium]
MILPYLPAFIQTLSLPRIHNAISAIASLYLSVLLRKPLVWGFPFVLTIEPTNHCNLHCPQCDTGSNRSKRPRGYLCVGDFECILQECKNNLIYLLLYDQGEPLLHPQYCELVRLAKNNHLYVVCSTNGMRLTDMTLVESLVQSKLDELIISVDGLDETTYQHYRKGGNLAKVVQGIRNVRSVRRALKTRTPRIAIQFIVMRHNESDLARLRTMALKWGVDRTLIKSAYVSSVEDAAVFLPDNKKYRRYRIENGQLLRKGRNRGLCKRCWYSAVVHWNGSIVPCCFDRNDHYILGSYPDPLKYIWKNKAYQKFRKAFFHSRPTICGNCTDGIKIYFS